MFFTLFKMFHQELTPFSLNKQFYLSSDLGLAKNSNNTDPHVAWFLENVSQWQKLNFSKAKG